METVALAVGIIVGITAIGGSVFKGVGWLIERFNRPPPVADDSKTRPPVADDIETPPRVDDIMLKELRTIADLESDLARRKKEVSRARAMATSEDEGDKESELARRKKEVSRARAKATSEDEGDKPSD